jgi:glycosyltransferase involved in cell wall biosynthesis
MTLHLACLPFPTYQGTQAAIDAMLRASAAKGRPTHLLTYAHGAHALDAPYEVHRLPDFPRVRSLRSGPSWGKVALDLRSIKQIRLLVDRLQPEAIVAHHIEAALASLAAGVHPVYYVAHTCLAAELPVYLPHLPTSVVRELGARLERFVCRRARGVAAVAPALASRLGERASYLPVPWTRSAQVSTRLEARRALGLPWDAPVCLYAGNLDPYQGWEHLLDAIRRLGRAHPKARLLIATESEPSAARREARRRGVDDRVDFRDLAGETARMRAHAASDVAWVPRQTEGGLPIKMLDAFGRGVPVIAMRRATAGLPVAKACRVVPNQDPDALAKAAGELIDDPQKANALRSAALDYLASHHDADSYENALCDWIGAIRTKARLHGRHPQDEPALRARRAPTRRTNGGRRARPRA